MKLLIFIFFTISQFVYASPEDNSLGISIGSPTALTGRYRFHNHILFASIGDGHISLDYSYKHLNLQKIDDTYLYYGVGLISKKHGGDSGYGPRIFGDLSHDLNPYFEVFAKSAFSILLYDKTSNYLDLAIGARYRF